MNQKLADVFEIDVVDDTPSDETKIALIEDSKSVEDADFSFARGNQYELIMQGKSAVTTAMHIAKQTENPRAIEVLAGLLKNVSEMNAALLKLSKEREDIKVVKKVSGGKLIQGPSIPISGDLVYSGTSASLNKLLKDDGTTT